MRRAARRQQRVRFRQHGSAAGEPGQVGRREVSDPRGFELFPLAREIMHPVARRVGVGGAMLRGRRRTRGGDRRGGSTGWSDRRSAGRRRNRNRGAGAGAAARRGGSTSAAADRSAPGRTRATPRPGRQRERWSAGKCGLPDGGRGWRQRGSKACTTSPRAPSLMTRIFTKAARHTPRAWQAASPPWCSAPARPGARPRRRRRARRWAAPECGRWRRRARPGLRERRASR